MLIRNCKTCSIEFEIPDAHTHGNQWYCQKKCKQKAEALKAKEIRIDLKAEGRCCCGKPAFRGLATCEDCGARKRANRKARESELKCNRCGATKTRKDIKICDECRQKSYFYSKKNADKIWARVRAAYGGFCKCCGEDDPAFLTMDHINNDGAEHRREIGALHNGRYVKGGVDFYRWVERNNFPSYLQLLCFNCNCAKHRVGVCPHQLGIPNFTGKLAELKEAGGGMVN